MAGGIVPPTNVTVISLFQSILNILPPLLLLVFMAVIIYGGYVRMTASGDPENEKRSTQILTAGVIGFVLIALAPLIVNLLGTFLGLGNLITP